MCLDQYKYINQIKQEGLFCENCMFFFYQQNKDRKQKLLSIS